MYIETKFAGIISYVKHIQYLTSEDLVTAGTDRNYRMECQVTLTMRNYKKAQVIHVLSFLNLYLTLSRKLS